MPPTVPVPVPITDGASTITQKLELLVAFFRGVHNFAEEGTGQLHWDEDPARSEIVIDAVKPIDPATISATPHIVVVPGPTSDMQLTLDNLQGYEMSSATRVKGILMQSYFVVYVVATTPLEATLIAEQCRTMVYAFQGLLERPGGFHTVARMGGISVNPPSAPGSLVSGDPSSHAMVQINVPTTWVHYITTTPIREAPHHWSIQQIVGSLRAREYVPAGMHVPSRIELRLGTRIIHGFRPRSTLLPDVRNLLTSFRVTSRHDILPRREDPP